MGARGNKVLGGRKGAGYIPRDLEVVCVSLGTPSSWVWISHPEQIHVFVGESRRRGISVFPLAV